MNHKPNHSGVGGFIPSRHQLTDVEQRALLKDAHKKLKQRIEQGGEYLPAQNSNTLVPLHRIKPLVTRLNELECFLGEKPQYWKKPGYGSLEYFMALRKGWIAETEEGKDRELFEKRRNQSLKTCHRYSGKWCSLPENPMIQSGGSYTPEISASVLNDGHLSAGAKVMAMKLMEVIYKENREGRVLETTVGYLARMLGKHKRTIQNYLSLLEHRGYIGANVVFNKLTRMSVGLVIVLNEPLFPKHHKEKWPVKRRKSGVQLNSFKILHLKNIDIVDRFTWAQRCMDGIFRSFMNNKTLGLPSGF